MNDDDDDLKSSKKGSLSSSKSFIKQPKRQATPTKLATTYEDKNEDIHDQDKIHEENEIYKKTQSSEEYEEQNPKLSLSTLSNYQNGMNKIFFLSFKKFIE